MSENPSDHFPAATTVPPSGQRRVSVAALVCLGLLVLLAAAIVIGLLATGGFGRSKAVPTGTPPQLFPVTSSGRSYTKATLAGYVPAIVAGRQTDRVPASSAPAGFARLLAGRQALGACIGVVSQGGPVLVPLGVDVGSFDGQPAAVFVLPVPGQPTVADVFVEGPGCASGRDATLYYERVPRPVRR